MPQAGITGPLGTAWSSAADSLAALESIPVPLAGDTEALEKVMCSAHIRAPSSIHRRVRVPTVTQSQGNTVLQRLDVQGSSKPAPKGFLPPRTAQTRPVLFTACWETTSKAALCWHKAQRKPKAASATTLEDA